MNLHDFPLSPIFPEEFLNYLKNLNYEKDSETYPVITASEPGGNDPAPSFDPHFIQQLEKRLELTFEGDGEASAKVCYANTEEVMPEFRTTFSPQDLLFYLFFIFATTENPRNSRSQGRLFSLPKDSLQFWEKVKLGQDNLPNR